MYNISKASVAAASDITNIAADAADGTIEAVEMPDHPWLIAVQWHPELTAADDQRQQALFNEFVNATRSLRHARRR